ncbi:MAG: Rpn family recombination-promoting nuclease/putative transposase, partial [Gammaproteobacteria bacterium]|nr:Rpn family recombination-promoting nuclease/putative transposase [Gammaproteobacteria bacterium]
MAMRHDEAFKFLFDLPTVCADLLRVAAPGLWPQLEPHSVHNLRVGDSVAADLTRRTGDALCRVDLQAAKLPDGRPAYLVVPVEFQSGDDQGMAERMGEYVSRQLDTLRRQGAIPADDTPPVLPVVVYDGAARWSAPDGLEPLEAHAPPKEAETPKHPTPARRRRSERG